MLCTLYECVSDKCLFEGNTETDQLFKIFAILGTPLEPRDAYLFENRQTWLGITDMPLWDQTWPQFSPIEYFITQISDCYKELFTKGFIMDPNLRPSAAEMKCIVNKYICD